MENKEASSASPPLPSPCSPGCLLEHPGGQREGRWRWGHGSGVHAQGDLSILVCWRVAGQPPSLLPNRVASLLGHSGSFSHCLLQKANLLVLLKALSKRCFSCHMVDFHSSCLPYWKERELPCKTQLHRVVLTLIPSSAWPLLISNGISVHRFNSEYSVVFLFTSWAHG